jgi:hypothetical protein
MRTRISTNLNWRRYIFITIAFIFMHDLFRLMIFHSSLFNLHFKIDFAIVVTGILAFYYYSQKKNVEYDSKYMYITLNKKARKIPLKDVLKIKATLIKLDNRETWTIDYLAESQVKKRVRFLPNKRNLAHFELFKSEVQQINPKVQIQNTPNTI